jgi:hypothetical protein
MRMYGGTFDPTTRALTNRSALVTLFEGKILAFSCNYLASRVRDRHITFATARAAASHVTPASREVAGAFVDALDDSYRTGNRIEATRFPAPSPAGSQACASQIAAGGLLGGVGL